MTLLWAKSGVATDAAVMTFLAGEDIVHDRLLFPYDVRATIAHVRGLARIDVLSNEEAAKLVAELERIGAAFAAGELVLDTRFEDGHTAIEAVLTERLGELGKRVHTGRSRNDQVLVAQRLYLRDRLAALQATCVQIARSCLARARRDGDLPLPGYTHLQRAVPSSIGLWMAAFAEAFADDAASARGAFSALDACPLGTAAGHGVSLPLDREGVARELGFSRVLVNPIYAQTSRGKLELLALGALEQALLDVRRLAWDLSLFATAEFAFVALDPIYVTGSSLMPNKKNPDVAELLRAQASVVAGARVEIASLLALPSGYHRDLQATKGPLVRAMESGLAALALVGRLVETMKLDAARMREAITPDLFATDEALALVARGVPFRDAYREVAERVASGSIGGDPTASLAARVSPGACADLRLGEIEARIEELAEERHGEG